MKNTQTIVALAIIVFIAIHFLYPPKFLALMADNFNKVAVGVAALITAYVGSTYFIEEHLRQKRIDSYRKNYPHDQYKKTWKIVVREDRDGEPHVLDIETSLIHHIWNMKTIYDLGWQFIEREPVKVDVFSQYQIGDKIRTRGELGE